jgi:hypothetical protein
MTPPPGYQPFGSGGFGAPVSHRKALISMILGIVGLFCVPFIFSILAIVLGVQARNEIDRSPGTYKNRGMATAGMVLGIVGIAFGALYIVRIIANN